MQINRKIDRQTDIQKDRWTDRWTDRQIAIEFRFYPLGTLKNSTNPCPSRNCHNINYVRASLSSIQATQKCATFIIQYGTYLCFSVISPNCLLDVGARRQICNETEHLGDALQVRLVAYTANWNLPLTTRDSAAIPLVSDFPVVSLGWMLDASYIYCILYLGEMQHDFFSAVNQHHHHLLFYLSYHSPHNPFIFT